MLENKALKFNFEATTKKSLEDWERSNWWSFHCSSHDQDFFHIWSNLLWCSRKMQEEFLQSLVQWIKLRVFSSLSLKPSNSPECGEQILSTSLESDKMVEFLPWIHGTFFLLEKRIPVPMKRSQQVKNPWELKLWRWFFAYFWKAIWAYFLLGRYFYLEYLKSTLSQLTLSQ